MAFSLLLRTIPARVGGHIELIDVQSDLNYHGASPLLVSIVDDS